MATLDYQTIMLPLLKLAGHGEEHSLRETIETLADEFGLTDEERRELRPVVASLRLTTASVGRGPT
jgi:restriction system protein